MKASKWAKRERNRHPASAARLAALYLMRDQLPDIPKTELAKRLGVSRWTVDRDLAALEAVETAINNIQLKEKEKCTN